MRDRIPGPDKAILLARAREMRAAPTPAEAQLWQRLRALRGHGVVFRRQAPIAGYIVDFLAASARLAIEVDGGVHDHEATQGEDARRDRALRAAGYEVLRVQNANVMKDVDAVVTWIMEHVRRRNS